MQSVQRQFGKLMSKNPGDNAKVSVILNDYEDADKVLAKIIENTKSLRDAWVSTATTQWGIVKEYEGLYDPIVGATDGHGRPSAPTPELQLTRTFKLQEAYSELKDELVEEITAIDTHIIRPATDAREYLQPIRKTIKKRENKRLDYEKSQDKVKKLHKKGNKTAKEDALLAKAEEEMARTAEEFEMADAHLRETLPPIISAAFELIPPLLATHVTIQNRLLGLYYTVLHNYCEENDFPSPAPPMSEVISDWSFAYKPIQKQAESIGCIAHGKAVRQPMTLPMTLPDDGQARKASTSSAASKNGFGRTSSGLIPSARDDGGALSPRITRISSSNSLQPATPEYSPQPSPRSSSTNLAVTRSNILAPTDFTTATVLGKAQTPDQLSRSDYFGRPQPLTYQSSGSVVGKKKPPPPPPVKRFQQPEEFVVAQYDFAGGSSGDLSFREGDRIKIVKKTNTDQDWWVGELGGVRGNFPANYCRAA